MADPLSPQEAYDRWAQDYDDADPSTMLDEPFLASMLQPREGHRILDLGCGTGRYISCVARGDIRIVGLDLSRGMLDRARRRQSAAVSVAWVQASVENLPIIPRTFDRLMSGLVMDHVENLDRFFGGIASVLAPGGRAVVTAVHPAMQRMTGPVVRFTASGRQYLAEGRVHEVQDIVAAAERQRLTIEELREPRVDETLVARRPSWRPRLGCPALLLLALTSGLER
jgi:malonyl-CoA O-methyltransferase